MSDRSRTPEVTKVVPQAAPSAAYRAHREAIDQAIRRALESGRYILGEEVRAFEDEFARYIGVAHAIGVANGTDAIELALRGLGIGTGDAVFTVSHTAVATVAAIERAGATPVLLDVDPENYTLDPDRLAAALARPYELGGLRPRAVVVVHLYGNPADLRAIGEIADRHGLLVVEDCAQAHGARLEGRAVGTWGHAAAFSFYPTKNLGAIGDGGTVVTGDSAVAERVRELRQYGWRDRYVSAIPGLNSRLDELQAAILRAKLPHLDTDNELRRRVAARYDQGLAATSLTTPAARSGAQHVYHQYVVRSDQRDHLAAALRATGIGTAVHYPVPVHRQPAYADRLISGDLAVTERIAGEVLSLPVFPELDHGDVERVIHAIREWFDVAGMPAR